MRKSRWRSASAAASTCGGAGGSMARTSADRHATRSRGRRRRGTCRPRSPRSPRSARPPAGARCSGHRALQRRPSPPRLATCSAQRSHIIPGPYFGYWNSSIRLVMSCLVQRRGSSALRTAPASDRFLIRCAAQSACSSVAGMPQTFSVYVLKKIRYSRQPKRADDPALEVASGPSAAAPGPSRYDADAADRLDEAQVAQRVIGPERVVEELAAVVDPAHPGPQQEVVVGRGSRTRTPRPGAPW